MPDRLTPEQRSRLMASVPSEDTGIEIAVRRAVHARGLRFRKHARGLPGTPDLVFPGPRVAVFVDGDFWHGWRFPAWRHKLTPYWADKIDGNRRRDRRNFARLRRRGWLVLRVWEHDVLADVERVADRIEGAVRGRQRRILGISPDDRFARNIEPSDFLASLISTTMISSATPSSRGPRANR